MLRGTIVPILALSLTLIGCSFWPQSRLSTEASELKPEERRNLAPNFSLKDSDGKTVQLSDYQGKVVLLNFWATWCGPCKMEIPWFIEFERKHKDQGFAVVGISMDDDGWQAVKPFVASVGINYRILLGNDEIAQAYGGVDSLPTTFMIDRQGRIAKVHLGLVSKSIYENDLQHLFETSSRTSGNGGTGRPAVVAGAR